RGGNRGTPRPPAWWPVHQRDVGGADAGVRRALPRRSARTAGSRSHGRRAGAADVCRPATDTIGFLDRIVGGPAHLVGWSDGGIVGLLVAIERSDLVRKLVAIWANYDTAGIAPEAEDMAANMATDS